VSPVEEKPLISNAPAGPSINDLVPTVDPKSLSPSKWPEQMAKFTFKEVVAAQVLLDRLNFSVNCIDGEYGRQTKEAVLAFQKAKGFFPSGELTSETLSALGDPLMTLSSYTLTEQDIQGLGRVPDLWKEKAALSTLPYVTTLEMVAEKFHATKKAIERLNPSLPWPNPPANSQIIVPSIERPPLKKAARIKVSLSRKTVWALDETNGVIGVFPCSIAQHKEKRPVGDLKVLNYSPGPNYTFDPKVFPESEEAKTINGKLIIPPGPNNPVGSAWVGLNLPGYGMHGTPNPEDIGHTESHGCFRLANWNASKLLKMIKVGTPVMIEE